MTAAQSRTRRACLIACATALLTSTQATHAAAGDYPQRPVRIVVPYSPASSADLLARLLTEKLTTRLNQTFIVENRPGAAGSIGTAYVATAAADGYTLMMSPTTHVINSAFRKTSYDPIKDFAPIAMVAQGPFLIVCNPANPAKNLKEFVDQLKADGDKATYSSPGIASTTHLYTALFQNVVGSKMRHVPAKNFTSGMMDVVQNQVTLMVLPVDVAQPLITAGKLRAIAQTGKKRSAQAPDLPTVAESGFPDYDAEIWIGLYAPAGTPKDIIAKLNAQAREVFNSPEMVQQIAQKGLDVEVTSPEQFQALNKAEYARWAEVIKQSGISPE